MKTHDSPSVLQPHTGEFQRPVTMMKTKPTAMALLLVMTSGCITWTYQHQALERRVAALEQGESERRQTLENARRQVETLQEQLEQARIQTRNMADLGARLDTVEEQLRSLHGAIAEIRRTIDTGLSEQNTQRAPLLAQLSALERRLLEVERRTGLAPLIDPNQIPNTPGDIMAQARQAYTSRDFARARVLATALLQRFPQDALADDARLLLGQIHLQENRAAAAAQEFQRLLTEYPTADTVPEAMTHMAEAFVRLGWCTQAQRTLRLLVERHGTTPQAQAARQRLEEIRHLPRAACSQ